MTITALFLALIATPGPANNGEPILLDFHASWCGPCQQMRPVVRRLKEMGYPIKSIDTDQSPELAERYNVSEVPTHIVIDSAGNVLDRSKGTKSITDLAEFYRSARNKVIPLDDGEGDAQDEEADSSGQERRGNAKPGPLERPNSNPKPWETVVRIKIKGNGMIGFGSGTIIASNPDESIILTCAHIFKIEGQAKYPPSRFPSPIAIDLFDGKLTSQKVPQVHPIETVAGEAIDYDFDRDVGLIRIRPGRRLPAAQVVPPSWKPERGLRMTTVGCSLGNDATAWSTSILNPLHRGLSGSPVYEAIECQFAPKQGRSGGGLFTEEGSVAGVCDFAEPRGNVGFYASPRSIYHILNRNNMMTLYTPAPRHDGQLMAKNSKTPRRSSQPPAIVRAQSQEDEDQGKITIPPHEMLGISTPKVAQTETRSTATPKWRISKSSTVDAASSDMAQSTDLSLPPEADSDRFAPPEKSSSDDSYAATNEDAQAPRSKSRWRRVRPGKPSMIASEVN